MDPADYQRLSELFREFVDLPKSEQQTRLAELDVSEQLRAELEAMLASDPPMPAFDDGRMRAAVPRLVEMAGQLGAGEDERTPGHIQNAVRMIGSYRIIHRLGQGGMGVVYAAQRTDSSTVCAVKLLRTDSGASTALLKRFHRESNVLRELRHPGIAAFYDAGEALVEFDQGEPMRSPYLAMELIEGSSLLESMRRQRLETADRVALIALVCDALHYAHERGVIHRDLKPDNILVVDAVDADGVGQPKILDFGVARTTHFDTHSITETASGMVIGTILYMSPEQIEGKTGIDRRSDIYAMGVLLYEGLSGELPLPLQGVSLAQAAVMIKEQDPALLGTLHPDLGGPLEVIVARALEKDRRRRYATARDLASDLRAYLAHRPIEAQRPGWTRRFQRWTSRHPTLAATMAVGLIALVGLTYLWKQAAVARDDAVEFGSLAQDRENEAVLERSYVLRLADLRTLRQLREQAEEAWPVHPDLMTTLTEWISDADEHVGRIADHEEFLAKLQRDPGMQARLTATESDWWIETLESLIGELRGFDNPETGELASMRARLTASKTIHARSITSAEDEWNETINKVARSAAYGGLEIEPQLGLVPLGVDPRSGLCEFWCVETGVRPERDAEGELRVTGESGIVLVLLPGGDFRQGAQSRDSSRPFYDSMAEDNECDPSFKALAMSVEPFFLSKYELTQGQWQFVRNHNPSLYQSPLTLGGVTIDLTHPVEQVSHVQCQETLFRWGLRIPTETEWEYACRAGTTTRYWTGDPIATLEGATNVADAAGLRTGAVSTVEPDLSRLEDGYPLHAPVDSHRGNPFGLHHMHGNVSEWVSDSYDGYWNDEDGKRPVSPMTRVEKVVRGGHFAAAARSLRSSARISERPSAMDYRLGVRPVRDLQR